MGIVIPTIFSRMEYLPQAARSIREAGDVFILLSSPAPTAEQQMLVDELISTGIVNQHLIETPDIPLGSKIDEALRSLPESCEYIGWLGDDDLLAKDSIADLVQLLDEKPNAAMVYGGIDYIDKDGRVLFTNPSSQFHEKLLRFGPQLIPQPGALWRRSSFKGAGGITGEFNLAFDFDFFLRLAGTGRLIHVPHTLAQFRWHPDSLSVKRRWVSVSEASKVRRKHYRGIMRLLWPLWEPLVMLATWFAGKLVSAKARSLSGRS